MKRLLLRTGLALTALFCLLPLYSISAHAAEFNQESTQTFGDYTVHYTAFNSTFILPEVASAYQLTRAKNQTLINISVHNKTGAAITATLNGYAQNLMQQQKKLSFKTITEQNAIYSIAALRITNEEVFNFVIEITPPNSTPFTLKFTRTLYVE
jgi:hypothetical protein